MTPTAYTRRRAGLGWSTIYPDFDFETYSEAGYTYDPAARKWRSISNSPPHGIGAVGAAVYAEHPSTRVLSLAYDLKDGRGPQIWLPDCPDPSDLFSHVVQGGLLEAWNSSFEYLIWTHVCTPRMGWPELRLEQLRDAMAKCRAYSLPGKLSECGKALRADALKIEDGTRLLNKFSKPRNPTKRDDRLFNDPLLDTVDGPKLYAYNLGDIAAEASISARVPDLSPGELELWLWDQRVNQRGVAIDHGGLVACLRVVNEAHEKYTAELVGLTNGAVKSPGELQKITGWIAGRGVRCDSLDASHVTELLARTDLPPDVRRVIEIRAALGSASVKKLYAISRRVSADGRLRDLFAFCGADRTGRWAGRGPQPQNLPNHGPDMNQCECGRLYGTHRSVCPSCFSQVATAAEWGVDAVEQVLEYLRSGVDLACVESVYGDALSVVSGCLRGLFVAGPGRDLICSDYSAIEAVALAALAGEGWRLEVFRSHGMIYEMSASKITGIPFEEFVRVKRETRSHHALRKKVGKIAELASQYGGGVGAWKKFGASDTIGDDETIQNAVTAWRKASPAIVAFWYGLEDAARNAIRSPGAAFTYRDISYAVVGDIMYCRLPSGRTLTYHEPRILPDTTPWGASVETITYMGRPSGYGAGSWTRLYTRGAKLAENVTQAACRDILAYAVVRLERAGYPAVLHIHDEIVAEIPAGTGSIEEFEQIMGTMPPWAADWPIRATGGWRGRRYRKD